MNIENKNHLFTSGKTGAHSNAQPQQASDMHQFEIPLTLIDRIAQWEGWLSIYEKRYIILALLFSLLLSIIACGVWYSQKQEKASLASFQASEILQEIRSTDYSSTMPAVSLLQNPEGEDNKSTLLKKQLAALIELGEKSQEAAEKSSGTLLRGAFAFKNDQTAALEKIDMEQCTALCNEYLKKINLEEYSSFNREMVSLQSEKTTQSADEEPLSNAVKAKKPASDLLHFLHSIASTTVSGSEKSAAARAFFSQYPDFADRFEQILEIKRENFYFFLEKEFGQQPVVSSKK